MKRVVTVVVAALLCAAQPAGLMASAAEAQAGTVKVTVTYKGKGGTVDATRKLWVWLFDTPNIGPDSQPIVQMALETNGSEAVFQSVAAGIVYIAVAFDEKGAMDGQGPPPPGTPISILADANGAPRGLAPGDKAIATLTFDDAMRMQ